MNESLPHGGRAFYAIQLQTDVKYALHKEGNRLASPRAHSRMHVHGMYNLSMGFRREFLRVI